MKRQTLHLKAPDNWVNDPNGFIFSGSAIEENGKLYLVYTGVRYEVVNPDDPHTCLNEQFESAQLMISSEGGFSFDNEHGKEIIIPRSQILLSVTALIQETRRSGGACIRLSRVHTLYLRRLISPAAWAAVSTWKCW